MHSLRGRCKELSTKLCEENPNLILVRGFYWCPIWNVRDQHWWTKDSNGVIHDPTKGQYPSNGCGEYTEFDGFCQCDECGTLIPEENAIIEGRYAFCCSRCYGHFVGIFQ